MHLTLPPIVTTVCLLPIAMITVTWQQVIDPYKMRFFLCNALLWVSPINGPKIFLSWPMMPSFVYITISGLMFVASIKTYKLKLLYILNEKADFQKHFFILQIHIYSLRKC